MTNDQPKDLQLMTVKEVAEMLRLRTQRVHSLVREGLLPTVRMGRQVRIPRKKLLDWIERGGTYTQLKTAKLGENDAGT